MPRSFAGFVRGFFLVAMLVGSALITWASLPYFDFETFPPFVVEKLPVKFEALWLASLRVHVAAATLTFPICLVLMTRSLQRRPALHRWLGRIAGIFILFALLPSGVVLAFDAKGGALVTLGFLLSGAIVGKFMVQGIMTARRRDFVSHRRSMRHVLAQMSVAVTSRALIIALDSVGIDPGLSYVIALWGPVLVSAAIAELISSRSAISIVNPVRRVERIHHDVFPFALLVRIRSFVRPLARLGR